VLDADRFPTVHAVMVSGAFEDESYTEAQGRDFDFGLRLLLDGLERLIGS
jgi:hypothetical protein